MKENEKIQKIYYGQVKFRWRHSINQFSKLQQESKLSILDTNLKKLSCARLKMKNRLAQIDEEFDPFTQQRFINSPTKKLQNKNSKIISTNHNTNVLTSQGMLTNVNLQKSILIQNPQNDQYPSQYDNMHVIHEVSDKIMEQLTQYNRTKYQNQMEQHCSKYNNSTKSFFYGIINSSKKQLPQFCYNCDRVVLKSRQNKGKQHVCQNSLNTLFKVQQALFKITLQVEQKNNKIFNVFLHNTLQPHVEINQLISNVSVLKQAIQLRYQPEQAILRMRLMNLIGKKIAMLIQQNELDEQLQNLKLFSVKLKK